MIEFLFLDLDDTILDFHKAEAVALTKTLREMDTEPAPELLERYKRINIACWKQLERGELTRERVKLEAFRQLFREARLDRDPTCAAVLYEKYLAIGHYFLPGAEEAVAALSKKYRLFLASNGTASVQAGRLTSANLYRYFEQVFVSQQIGSNKPNKAYFDRCFGKIPGFDKSRAMIVGDSLTSDILGGNNAGIRTCWVNPGHMPRVPGIHVDLEIETLSQLEALLETLKE